MSTFHTELGRLLEGRIGWLAIGPDGRVTAGDSRPDTALLSGAFHPLHEGHRQLAAVAAEILDRAVDFELPLVNADKGVLDADEAERRAAQFAGRATVVLTKAPLFEEKARLFPESVFVVGADTAARLLEPRFYGHDEARIHEALESFKRSGCRFLVAGRASGGKVLTLKDLAVPKGYEGLFEAVPTMRFRLDISSTALRRGR